MKLSRKVRLAAYPDGLPKESDWTLTEEPIEQPGPNEVLIANEYLSLDPAMRGWVTPVRSYLPPVEIGAVMRAGGIGKVVAVGDGARFSEGDIVTGMTGVQEHAVVNDSDVRKVDPSVAPLPVHLGTLGMPGFTAYFGLFDIGKPEPGQTVLVSAAAGAVGSIAGQLAKAHGCRVVGLAGGPEKCAMVTDELGFDACIDYKNEDVAEAVRRECPDRIDVYFDNVGGEILDAALQRLNMHARVVICGGISQYNSGRDVAGPKNYLTLITNRARMEGFVVLDYFDRIGEALRYMAPLVRDSSLKSREHIVGGGLAAFNETLLMLFRGENTGKLVLAL
jgi:NADPH-dependent curcumin reductase CurA